MSSSMRQIVRSQFSIVHCSSQDSGHAPSALLSPSPWSKGWLSAKFCLYPQEIVLGLKESAKLVKLQLVSHSHCIASKVEFFIGDCPTDEPRHVNNVRWSRLGYVALLSNNNQATSNSQKGEGPTRELKSVHLEANGCYVKLCLHSNHEDRRNPYNQVGIAALAVLSEPADTEPSDAASGAAYQSPYVDLAFDLSCHPGVAELIRRLDWEKRHLVAMESLTDAKAMQSRISAAVTRGHQLAQLEALKSRAIEAEDYELAEVCRLEIRDKLAAALADDSNYDDVGGGGEVPDAELEAKLARQSVELLPAAAATSTKTTSAQQQEQQYQGGVSYDDTPLPALKAGNTAIVVEDPGADAIEEPPPPPGDFVAAEETSGVLPPQLVAKSASTSRSVRAEALAELTSLVTSGGGPGAALDAVAFYRAALVLAQRGCQDAAVTVHEAALPLCRALLTAYADSHSLSGSELHYGCCRLAPQLLAKLGDTAPRLRDSARDFLLEMAAWPKIRQLPDAPVVHACLRPLRQDAATLERQTAARVQLASALYKKLGLSPPDNAKAASGGGSGGGKSSSGGSSGVSPGALLTFGFSALRQRHAETRRAAEALILEVAAERPDCRAEANRRLKAAMSQGEGAETPAFKSLASKLK